MQAALKPEVFRAALPDFAAQNPKWNEIPASTGEVYPWDPKQHLHPGTAVLRRSSPCGPAPSATSRARGPSAFSATASPPTTSPRRERSRRLRRRASTCWSTASRFEDFNSYGSRRGNDRVMTRGTFANVRIKNLMLGGEEGGNTLPAARPAKKMSDLRRRDEVRRDAHAARRPGRPGIRHRLFARLGGQGHGLLGVKAVVAQSFERIHRSNLVGMGVLPLQFKEGAARQSLKLDGTELYEVLGLGAASQAAAGSHAADHAARAARRKRCRSVAGSIRRSRSSITITAASCPSCSGSCWQRPEPAPATFPARGVCLRWMAPLTGRWN